MPNLKTTDKKPSSSLMAQLLSAHQVSIPKVGEIVEGIVIQASKNEVHLDLNGIATGVVRGREVLDESGDFSDLKVGQKAQAVVIDLETENGELELSFRQAGHKKAWENLIELKEKGEIVAVKITEANRGGLMVRLGKMDGFLPVSQLIPEHYPRVDGGDKNKILERLTEYIGQTFKVKVIDVNEEDDKLIVSEKAAWEEAQQKVIAGYQPGDIIEGRATGVVDFGVFVEFGQGLEGLVHISELAWQRIDNPRNLVKVGDKIKAKIISIEGSKISLSMKKLVEDPWKESVKKYTIGQVVKGKILKYNPFGVFVELDENIHGLAHISELADRIISHPSEIVKLGETYDFKILSIEPENHRLGLSLKSLTKAEYKEDKKEPEAQPAPQSDSKDEELKKDLAIADKDEEIKKDSEPAAKDEEVKPSPDQS